MLRRNLRSVVRGWGVRLPRRRGRRRGSRTCHGRAGRRGRCGVRRSVARGRTSGALGFWVAAIRESFEEAGVLLARGRGSRVHRSTLSSSAALLPLRDAVAAGEQSFAELVRPARRRCSTRGRCRVVAHWITPSPAPRRYDTWFFVAPAPPGHAYRHDSGETVASEWVAPADALAASPVRASSS